MRYKLVSALIGSLLASSALAAASKPNLVCVIQDAKDKKKYVSSTCELKKIKECDGLYTEDTLIVGDDAFGFSWTATDEGDDLKKGQIAIDVVFSEHEHVEDEIGNQAWVIDTLKAKPRKPVVEEPLEYNGKLVANFLCYYNK